MFTKAARAYGVLQQQRQFTIWRNRRLNPTRTFPYHPKNPSHYSHSRKLQPTQLCFWCKWIMLLGFSELLTCVVWCSDVRLLAHGFATPVHTSSRLAGKVEPHSEATNSIGHYSLLKRRVWLITLFAYETGLVKPSQLFVSDTTKQTNLHFLSIQELTRGVLNPYIKWPCTWRMAVHSVPFSRVYRSTVTNVL